jgi:glycosyltransferase involved in cell wall biosynthesis
MNLSRFEHLTDPLLIRKELFGDSTSDLFVAGMVATFDERKDYKMLIEAAIPIVTERNNIRFVLVGDGKDFQNVKKLVPGSLLNKIIFLGKRTDVESIVNVFDVGILLTNAKVHGEGISNSLIEYMALGKPVIATHGGGTDEVVLDNQNGFLIDPGNTGQLTQKIIFLMDNKPAINKLGNEGKEMIKRRFDLRIMTKNYVELYKRLV